MTEDETATAMKRRIVGVRQEDDPMADLRALKRSSTGLGLRRRSVQGRLSIAVGDEQEGGESPQADSAGRSTGFRRPAKTATSEPVPRRPKAAAPVFHPLAYRSVVAGWSLESREQWGRRANELEETGLPWRDAETQAFVEVWHQLRSLDAIPASTPDLEADPH